MMAPLPRQRQQNKRSVLARQALPTPQDCSPFHPPLPAPSHFQLSQHFSIPRFFCFTGQYSYHGNGAITHQRTYSKNSVDPFAPISSPLPISSCYSITAFHRFVHFIGSLASAAAMARRNYSSTKQSKHAAVQQHRSSWVRSEHSGRTVLILPRREREPHCLVER